MRQFKTIFLLFAMLGLLCLTANAQTQEMPPAIGTYLGAAQGCTVDTAMQMPDVEICTLVCPGQSPDMVMGYYTAQLTANAFDIQHKAQYPGGMMVVAARGASTASVDVSQEQGAVMVNLTLDGVGTLDIPTTSAPAPAPATNAAPDMASEPATAPAEAAAPASGSNPMIPWGSGQSSAAGSGTSAATTTDTATDTTAAATDDAGAAADTSGTMEVSGSGVSTALWEQVSPKPGDQITEEFISNGVPCADLTSTSDPRTVLEYYRDQLKAKGWSQMVLHVEDDGGMLQMYRGNENFQVFAQQADSGQGTEYMLAYSKQ